LMSGASWFLPRIVGFARATEIILTGRHLDAKEALEIGRDWVMMTSIPFQKVREMWGKVIATAIAGEPIEELAHKTAEEINALLLEVGDNPASYLDPNQLYMPKNVYRTQ